MLTIAPDKLGYIIAKARAFDGESEEDPDEGSSEADDSERAILAAGPENPSEDELRAALDQLNDDERIELLALVWLGRGDYAAAEWRRAKADARAAHDAHESAYLVGTPLLADYIEEGLAALGEGS
jgi:hypothetical protein